MMKSTLWTWAALLFFACLAAAAFSLAASQSSSQPRVVRAEAVVKIALPKGHGSGFHIGDGYIVTANHVVANQTDVKVLDSQGGEQSAELLWQNADRDLALLKVDDASALDTDRLSCRHPKIGEAVIAKGSPLKTDFVSFWGHISGVARTIGPWKHAMIVDITGAPGISGGPVYDSRGRVIGVFVGVSVAPVANIYPSLTGISLVVPATAVCDLLARK